MPLLKAEFDQLTQIAAELTAIARAMARAAQWMGWDKEDAAAHICVLWELEEQLRDLCRQAGP